MYNMKSLSLIAALLLSGSALAGIQITDSKQGAWVRVTDNNKSSVNAKVSIINSPMQNGTYLTDDKGMVYIPIATNSSHHLKYQAITEDGNKFTKSSFHSRDK